MKSLTLLDKVDYQAKRFPDRKAIVWDNVNWTYAELASASIRLASEIAERPEYDRQHLAGERVAILVKPGGLWMASMLACWRLGMVTVPLSVSHPIAEWEYVLSDCGCKLLVVDALHLRKLSDWTALPGLRVKVVDAIGEEHDFGNQDSANSPFLKIEGRPTADAQIIYTSGSTGRPKGVVTTHSQIAAQIQSLIEAWQWSSSDHILNVLPLHHVHGIVNVYYCALWSGAQITEWGTSEPGALWAAFCQVRPTLFMAVPTIYYRLTKAFESASPEEQMQWKSGCDNFRLMVSGSAALRIDLLYAWKNITRHTLLERYGMTEIGMALSNPLHGERKPGHVGYPLPGVSCRVVSDQGEVINHSTSESITGELQVKGPGVFSRYWNRPEETAKSFDGDWFITGDAVERTSEGLFRIVGRLSVDIIKSGGYKISALEIEEELRQHPVIEDCAVIGLPDPQWGQQVAAVLVVRPGCSLCLEELRSWGKQRLAAYKLPVSIRVLEFLPRNAMGKVVKPELISLF